MKRDAERPPAASRTRMRAADNRQPRIERRPPIKVMVGDERFLMREGIKQLLGRLGRVLTTLEAADAAGMLRLASEHPDLDLMIVDLALPGIGDHGIASLHTAAGKARIIALCDGRSPADVEGALRSGAAGCIADGCSDKVMLQVIELVLAGGQYLPPMLLSREDRGSAAATTPDAAAPKAAIPAADAIGPHCRALSHRQRQVVGLLAEGLSNKMIAMRLGLVEGTVKTHLAQIFQILGVRNRTSAVMAIRDGGADLAFRRH